MNVTDTKLVVPVTIGALRPASQEPINFSMDASIVMATHSRTPGEDFTQFLWKFIPPFVILLGTAGNALSFSVMFRQKLSDTPMSLCIRLLALVDTVVLWTGYLRYWIWKTLDYDIRQQHSFVCKGHALLVHWSTQYASWILICIAIDRFSVVYLPTCAKQSCNKFRMGICLFCIGLILLLVNSHFICTVQLNNDSLCIVVESNTTKWFMHDIWPWIDLGIYSIVPFILISICNVCIIINLYMKQKNSTVKSGSTRYFLTRGRVNTMAYMLLIISCAFILTTLPIATFMIINMSRMRELSANEELCFAVVNFLSYMNSAWNFILYCISSSYFRRELVSMLSCGRKDGIDFDASRSGKQRLSLQNINEGSSSLRHDQAYDQLVPVDGSHVDL